MILVRRQRVITRRDIARPPELATAGFLTSNLLVAHDLTGPHWATNLVTGLVAGASVGTGPVVGALGYLATPNSNGNGFTIPHRLSSAANSWTIAVGMAKTAGSTCFSCMTTDVDAWTGWYSNSDTSMNSSFENSFDGSASAAGTRDQNGMSSMVFTYGGANTLSAYGNSKNSQTDTAAVAPFGAYSFPSLVSFGFAKHGSFSDNPSACRFSHFYVWNRVLSPFEAWSIAENPRRIFAPRLLRKYVPGIGGGSDLAASGGATAAGAADLSTQIALAAVGVAVAGGSGSLSTSIPLAAAGLAVASGSAGLEAQITLAAAGLAAAAGAAGLSTEIMMAGAAAAQAAGNAELATAITLAASGGAVAGGAADLSTNPPGGMAASGGAQAGGSADLTVSITMAATGAAAAAGSAPLVTQITLSAAGFVQAMGVGALTTAIPLAALGAAAAGGSASLSGGAVVALDPDPRYTVGAVPVSRIVRAVARDYTVRAQ